MRQGMGGFGGSDAEDWMLARQTLAQADLCLVALALIAEAPRHGYDIIKRLQEKTAGWCGPILALFIRRLPACSRLAT